MVECYLIQHFVVPKANSHIGLNMVLTNVDTTCGKNNFCVKQDITLQFTGPQTQHWSSGDV